MRLIYLPLKLIAFAITSIVVLMAVVLVCCAVTTIRVNPTALKYLCSTASFVLPIKITIEDILVEGRILSPNKDIAMSISKIHVIDTDYGVFNTRVDHIYVSWTLSNLMRMMFLPSLDSVGRVRLQLNVDGILRSPRSITPQDILYMFFALPARNKKVSHFGFEVKMISEDGLFGELLSIDPGILEVSSVGHHNVTLSTKTQASIQKQKKGTIDMKCLMDDHIKHIGSCKIEIDATPIGKTFSYLMQNKKRNIFFSDDITAYTYVDLFISPNIMDRKSKINIIFPDLILSNDAMLFYAEDLELTFDEDASNLKIISSSQYVDAIKQNIEDEAQKKGSKLYIYQNDIDLPKTKINQTVKKIDSESKTIFALLGELAEITNITKAIHSVMDTSSFFLSDFMGGKRAEIDFAFNYTDSDNFTYDAHVATDSAIVPYSRNFTIRKPVIGIAGNGSTIRMDLQRGTAVDSSFAPKINLLVQEECRTSHKEECGTLISGSMNGKTNVKSFVNDRAISHFMHNVGNEMDFESEKGEIILSGKFSSYIPKHIEYDFVKDLNITSKFVLKNVDSRYFKSGKQPIIIKLWKNNNEENLNFSSDIGDGFFRIPVTRKTNSAMEKLYSAQNVDVGGSMSLLPDISSFEIYVKNKLNQVPDPDKIDMKINFVGSEDYHKLEVSKLKWKNISDITGVWELDGKMNNAEISGNVADWVLMDSLRAAAYRVSSKDKEIDPTPGWASFLRNTKMLVSVKQTIFKDVNLSAIAKNLKIALTAKDGKIYPSFISTSFISDGLTSKVDFVSSVAKEHRDNIKFYAENMYPVGIAMQVAEIGGSPISASLLIEGRQRQDNFVDGHVVMDKIQSDKDSSNFKYSKMKITDSGICRINMMGTIYSGSFGCIVKEKSYVDLCTDKIVLKGDLSFSSKKFDDAITNNQTLGGLLSAVFKYRYSSLGVTFILDDKLSNKDKKTTVIPRLFWFPVFFARMKFSI